MYSIPLWTHVWAATLDSSFISLITIVGNLVNSVSFEERKWPHVVKMLKFVWEKWELWISSSCLLSYGSIKSTWMVHSFSFKVFFNFFLTCNLLQNILVSNILSPWLQKVIEVGILRNLISFSLVDMVLLAEINVGNVRAFWKCSEPINFFAFPSAFFNGILILYFLINVSTTSIFFRSLRGRSFSTRLLEKYFVVAQKVEPSYCDATGVWEECCCLRSTFWTVTCRIFSRFFPTFDE